MVEGYINVPGTSTHHNDNLKTLTFKKVLGEEVTKQEGTTRTGYIV